MEVRRGAGLAVDRDRCSRWSQWSSLYAIVIDSPTCTERVIFRNVMTSRSIPRVAFGYKHALGQSADEAAFVLGAMSPARRLQGWGLLT